MQQKNLQISWHTSDTTVQSMSSMSNYFSSCYPDWNHEQKDTWLNLSKLISPVKALTFVGIWIQAIGASVAGESWWISESLGLVILHKWILMIHTAMQVMDLISCANRFIEFGPWHIKKWMPGGSRIQIVMWSEYVLVDGRGQSGHHDQNTIVSFPTMRHPMKRWTCPKKKQPKTQHDITPRTMKCYYQHWLPGRSWVCSQPAVKYLRLIHAQTSGSFLHLGNLLIKANLCRALGPSKNRIILIQNWENMFSTLLTIHPS